VLLRAAHYAFRVEDSGQGLRQMAAVLARVRDYDGIIFHTYERFGVPVERVLETGIPQDRKAAQSYFRHLIAGGNLEGLGKTWEWVGARSLADDALAGEYVSILLRQRQYGAAIETWSRHLGGKKGDYWSRNSLFNSGFESEPTGCRLDWTVQPVNGAAAGLDGRVPFAGGKSLQIRFAGTENLDYRHVSQAAVVSPGRYRLRARVRTESITTDQGIGLRVVDPEAPGRLSLRVGNLTGTRDWEKLEATLAIPAQTRLVEVQVVREPSLKFDNKIGGTAWLDEVELVREGS
jgi:hypothetical protein